ncbi:MAG: hypothetical protein IPM85_06380 [Chitinophagaceae bacterium]|nr:hypothetical protein [Chitinophagaceae bacterium]
MKKRLLSAALIAAVLFTTSCGSSSSFESDVRKKANYMCEIQKLEAKAATDEKAAKEMESIKKEMDAFDEKMEKKYDKKEPTEAQQKKAREIMEEVMAKCK